MLFLLDWRVLVFWRGLLSNCPCPSRTSTSHALFRINVDATGNSNKNPTDLKGKSDRLHILVFEKLTLKWTNELLPSSHLPNNVRKQVWFEFFFVGQCLIQLLNAFCSFGMFSFWAAAKNEQKKVETMSRPFCGSLMKIEEKKLRRWLQSVTKKRANVHTNIMVLTFDQFHRGDTSQSPRSLDCVDPAKQQKQGFALSFFLRFIFFSFRILIWPIQTRSKSLWPSRHLLHPSPSSFGIFCVCVCVCLLKQNVCIPDKQQNAAWLHFIFFVFFCVKRDARCRLRLALPRRCAIRSRVTFFFGAVVFFVSSRGHFTTGPCSTIAGFLHAVRRPNKFTVTLHMMGIQKSVVQRNLKTKKQQQQ